MSRFVKNTLIDTAETILEEFDSFGKFRPYSEKWTLKEAQEIFGTYRNKKGELITLNNSAMKIIVEMIAYIREVNEEDKALVERLRNYNKTMDAKRVRAEEFAGMSDRQLGQYLKEYLAEEDQREPDYTPDWMVYVAQRLGD